MNTLNQVKGMRDLYPADYQRIRELRDTWTGIGEAWGYQEFEAPILETVALYLSKSSEELINKQSFRVVDRKGRELLMRPELTPSLARMIAKKESDLVFPIRWQSFGQFFRYEKPQKGRTRSFYQWNIDLIGSDSILADVEILLIAGTCLSEIGLSPENVKIRINNRKLLVDALLSSYEVSQDDVPAALTILDRIDKVGPDVTSSQLEELGLSSSKAEDLLAYMGSGSWSSDPWFEEVKAYLDDSGLSEWFEVDFRIIRGLDYYTGMVFEAWATGGLSRALFGGGRYDGLMQLVGSSRGLPGVGFAAGDVAITALLDDLEMSGAAEDAASDVLVTVFDAQCVQASLAVSRQMRENGLRVQLYPDLDVKLGKQLDYARRAGIRFALIIGPDEAQQGIITIKDLQTGNQTTVEPENIPAFVRGATSPPSR